MTEENKIFYEKLQQSNILKGVHGEEVIIEYPYNFIKNSTDDLLSKIEMFLKESSTDYLERSQDKLEIKKSTSPILWIGLGGLAFINILVQNITFFLVTSFIGIPTIFYFLEKTRHTPYLILTKRGFEFPKASLKLDWNVIKLIEVQNGTRDTSGALIIWFNNINRFINKNPGFFSRIDGVLDYDGEKLKKNRKIQSEMFRNSSGRRCFNRRISKIYR